MTLYIVYVDSDYKNVRGMFAVYADAVAYQATLGISSDIATGKVSSYELVTTQVITLG